MFNLRNNTKLSWNYTGLIHTPIVFSLLDKELHSPVGVVIAGGASCVITLSNRQETADVDYILPSDASADERKQLKAAIAKVNPQDPRWMNDEISSPLNANIEKLVFDNRIQATPVFRGQKLTVWNAPWDFQFTRKTILVEQEDGKIAKDIDDAVAFLHALNSQTKKVLTVQELKALVEKYDPHASQDKDGAAYIVNGVQDVNKAYESKYHTDGVNGIDEDWIDEVMS